MSYFQRFPYVKDYEIQGRLYTGLDLSRRTGIDRELFNNPDAYIDYEIQNGETPEIIADRFYDDSGLYWVIMEFNKIGDVTNDWPLSSVSFERYIDRVYGEDRNEIHHYISASSGNVVYSEWPEYDRIPITNYEHELNLNEEKRFIKLLIPRLVGNMVREHNRLIQQ